MMSAARSRSSPATPCNRHERVVQLLALDRVNEVLFRVERVAVPLTASADATFSAPASTTSPALTGAGVFPAMNKDRASAAAASAVTSMCTAFRRCRRD
jgi:hypothetical protein